MSLLSRISSVARTAPASWSRNLRCYPVQRLSTITVGAASSEQPNATPAEATASSAQVRPHHIIMSISGPDRPGIIKSVTEAVAEHDANVEESKMAILGGDFAMIVYVSIGSADNAEKLAVSIRGQLDNFSISVRETVAPTTEDRSEPLWTLTLQGPDHPGIVAAVSEALATNGCNVHELETETSSAPFAGYRLFTINGSVSVDESKLDKLSDALNKVEDHFGSTISLVKNSLESK